MVPERQTATQTLGFMWRGSPGLSPSDLCLSSGLGPAPWPVNQATQPHDARLRGSPDFFGPYCTMNLAGMRQGVRAACVITQGLIFSEGWCKQGTGRSWPTSLHAFSMNAVFTSPRIPSPACLQRQLSPSARLLCLACPPPFQRQTRLPLPEGMYGATQRVSLSAVEARKFKAKVQARSLGPASLLAAPHVSSHLYLHCLLPVGHVTKNSHRNGDSSGAYGERNAILSSFQA